MITPDDIEAVVFHVIFYSRILFRALSFPRSQYEEITCFILFIFFFLFLARETKTTRRSNGCTCGWLERDRSKEIRE